MKLKVTWEAGSITYLYFATKSHLLSAAEDGSIYLYHTRDWSILATLNGHKGRVNDVAVHPSAKVGLSVGKDRTLRMWDLMRGKGSASVKLGKGMSVLAPGNMMGAYLIVDNRGRRCPMDAIRDTICDIFRD
jgi:protein MAK11